MNNEETKELNVNVEEIKEGTVNTNTEQINESTQRTETAIQTEQTTQTMEEAREKINNANMEQRNVSIMIVKKKRIWEKAFNKIKSWLTKELV